MEIKNPYYFHSMNYKPYFFRIVDFENSVQVTTIIAKQRNLSTKSPRGLSL